jgi:hypothetical protein
MTDREASMRKVLLSAAAAIVVVVATTSFAGAGTSAQMTATPNPVTVGSPFTISNVAGPASTCEEDGLVEIAIFEAEGTDPISTQTVPPDEDGNWSATGTASVVGSFVIEAECVGEGEEEQPSGMAPQAVPDFSYAPVPFQVVPVPTTTTSTTTTTVPGEPPTTEAPDTEGTVVTPAFTG